MKEEVLYCNQILFQHSPRHTEEELYKQSGQPVYKPRLEPRVFRTSISVTSGILMVDVTEPRIVISKEYYRGSNRHYKGRS
jgi:hypothetical protein